MVVFEPPIIDTPPKTNTKNLKNLKIGSFLEEVAILKLENSHVQLKNILIFRKKYVTTKPPS